MWLRGSNASLTHVLSSGILLPAKTLSDSGELTVCTLSHIRVVATNGFAMEKCEASYQRAAVMQPIVGREKQRIKRCFGQALLQAAGFPTLAVHDSSVQWEAIIQFAVLQVEAERFVEMDGRVILFPDVQVERFQVMFVAREVDDV